jgi:hypothetical protein
MEMEIEGSYHGGAIVYEAIVDPKAAGFVIALTARRYLGSPFRVSVPAKAEHFRILRGQPKIYVKAAASGAKRSQAICADCGTPIHSAASDSPTHYNLRLGAAQHFLARNTSKVYLGRRTIDQRS